MLSVSFLIKKWTAQMKIWSMVSVLNTDRNGFGIFFFFVNCEPVIFPIAVKQSALETVMHL